MGNSIFFWVLFISIILIIIYLLLIIVYNSITKKKEDVDESFAQIKNFSAKKQDLIPVITEILKKYTDYESKTLGKLNGLIKQYPELKANSGFLELKSQLEYVENEIVGAKTLYNKKVREFNSSINYFPQNFVAFILKVKEKKYFNEEEGI